MNAFYNGLDSRDSPSTSFDLWSLGNGDDSDGGLCEYGEYNDDDDNNSVDGLVLDDNDGQYLNDDEDGSRCTINSSNSNATALQPRLVSAEEAKRDDNDEDDEEDKDQDNDEDKDEDDIVDRAVFDTKQDISAIALDPEHAALLALNNDFDSGGGAPPQLQTQQQLGQRQQVPVPRQQQQIQAAENNNVALNLLKLQVARLTTKLVQLEKNFEDLRDKQDAFAVQHEREKTLSKGRAKRKRRQPLLPPMCPPDAALSNSNSASANGVLSSSSAFAALASRVDCTARRKQKDIPVNTRSIQAFATLIQPKPSVAKPTLTTTLAKTSKQTSDQLTPDANSLNKMTQSPQGHKQHHQQPTTNIETLQPQHSDDCNQRDGSTSIKSKDGCSSNALQNTDDTTDKQCFHVGQSNEPDPEPEPAASNEHEPAASNVAVPNVEAAKTNTTRLPTHLLETESTNQVATKPLKTKRAPAANQQTRAPTVSTASRKRSNTNQETNNDTDNGTDNGTDEGADKGTDKGTDKTKHVEATLSDASASVAETGKAAALRAATNLFKTITNCLDDETAAYFMRHTSSVFDAVLCYSVLPRTYNAVRRIKLWRFAFMSSSSSSSSSSSPLTFNAESLALVCSICGDKVDDKMRYMPCTKDRTIKFNNIESVMFLQRREYARNVKGKYLCFCTSCWDSAQQLRNSTKRSHAKDNQKKALAWLSAETNRELSFIDVGTALTKRGFAY